MSGDAPTRVLLVDDDLYVARTIGRLLTAHGCTLDHVSSREEIARLTTVAGHADQWDVILLDIHIDEIDGLDVLARLRTIGSRTAVVMLTGDASAASATEALRGGAFHYIVKPVVPAKLFEILELAVRHTNAHRDRRGGPLQPAAGDTLVGSSPAMTAIRRVVARMGASDASVLIGGESGTGKEVVARALHAASPRRGRPFVAVNCAAIPDGLIDSELFGHARGAFTGATAARPGVFVEADGGTLFLDEVGDMPVAVQARLLRALQEGEVRPVGGDGVRSVDVRVIAATNVDLTRAVQDGRFRSDLYFRLNVLNLHVPPLRERRDDVPELVAALLARHAGPERPAVDADALAALTAYDWPGNVRELDNALLHALAMRGTTIDLAALPPAIVARTRPPLARGSQITPLPPDLPLTDAKRQAAADFEHEYLRRILARANGSVSAAARLAGVDRTNFRRLLHRHGIDTSRSRS